MKIRAEVPAAELEPGTIVAWKDSELYFVVEAPEWDVENPTYGTVVLREGDGEGYMWTESIYLFATFTTVSP